MKRALALCLLLTACAHDNTTPPVTAPPKAPDPVICATIPAEPAVRGALVQPVTEDEKADFDAFASGEWAARRWGRLGWGVVGVAQRQFCQ